MNQLANILSAPLLARQGELAVWVADCCNRGIVTTQEPDGPQTCRVCGQALEISKVTSVEGDNHATNQ